MYNLYFFKLIKMRCIKCRKKKSILIECKYCKNEYCSFCCLPEIHKCKNINICKKRKLDELETKLESEKIEKNKIIKI